jgi:hypothetical protein
MTELDKRDILIGLVAGLMLLVYFLYKDVGPLLVNEPCAPSHPVITNGTKVGCTGDEANGYGYYPRKEK